MAITTLDQAAAGATPPQLFAKALTGTLVAGQPRNLWYLGGVPGSAAAPTPGINGAALTTYGGQLPMPAASGDTHLHRFSAVSSAQGGLLMLCDRLWHNSMSATNASAQAIVSPTWPARDANGSTNGEKVYLALEVSATTGTGTAVPSVAYTSSDGTGSRPGTMLDVYPGASTTGSFFRMALQAGDTGCRSVETYSQTLSMTSGSLSLVAYRVLATLELPAAGVPNAVDFLTSGGPRFYDNTVPFVVFIPQTTTTTLVTSTVVFTQG